MSLVHLKQLPLALLPMITTIPLSLLKELNMIQCHSEVIRRRRRKISRKPNIATINEWKSQEEQELDPEQDTFVNVSLHRAEA